MDGRDMGTGDGWTGHGDGDGGWMDGTWGRGMDGRDMGTGDGWTGRMRPRLIAHALLMPAGARAGLLMPAHVCACLFAHACSRMPARACLLMLAHACSCLHCASHMGS
eukprot:356103-Chlamydomonas_euryale.AAC.1